MDKTSTPPSWAEVINLLANLVVFNKYDFKEFLQRLTHLSNEVIPTDSCLIYFHDKQIKKSTLVASNKPHKDTIGKITMIDGEGITGWVAENKETVVIKERAYNDSRFKFFKELPEDKFEAFLSVPIVDETGVVGVMNFQDKMPYPFEEQQIKAIEAIAKIISSAFAKTLADRKVTDLEEKLEERKIIEKAKGVLMKVKDISEDEAFKLLRTESMNKRKSMKEIAEAILLIWQ